MQEKDALHLLNLIAGSLLKIDKTGKCIKIITLKDWPEYLLIPQENKSLIELIPVVRQSEFKASLRRAFESGQNMFFRMRKNVGGVMKSVLISIFKEDETSVVIQVKEDHYSDNELWISDDNSLPKAEGKSFPHNNLLKTILEYTPFLIFVKDVSDEFRYLYNNVALSDLRKDIPYLGKNDFEILPIDLAQRYYLEDKQVVKSGEPQRFIHTHTVNNVEYITETLKILVEEPKGSPILIGIVRDVTEQFQKHRDLLKVIDETKEAESL
ncbi:MAG: PAS domain-containing protein [Bacteroidales bacterium]